MEDIYSPNLYFGYSEQIPETYLNNPEILKLLLEYNEYVLNKSYKFIYDLGEFTPPEDYNKETICQCGHKHKCSDKMSISDKLNDKQKDKVTFLNSNGFRVFNLHMNHSRTGRIYITAELVPDMNEISILRKLTKLLLARESLGELTNDQRVYFNLMDSFYFSYIYNKSLGNNVAKAIYMCNVGRVVYDEPVSDTIKDMIIKASQKGLLPYRNLYDFFEPSYLVENYGFINTDKIIHNSDFSKIN